MNQEGACFYRGIRHTREREGGFFISLDDAQAACCSPFDDHHCDRCALPSLAARVRIQWEGKGSESVREHVDVAYIKDYC